jgi:hypothetical protein
VPRLKRDFLLLLAVALAVVTSITVAGALTADEPTRMGRRLPAFHQLTRQDLNRPDRGLEGRYTLVEMPRGKRIEKSKLGPRLAPGSLTARAVTTVPVVADAGAIARMGDDVTIRWTPAGATTPESVGDVLVLRMPAHGRAVIAAPVSAVTRLPTTEPVQFTRP